MQAALTSPAVRRRAFVTLGALALALAAIWLATHIPRTLSVFVIAAFIAFGVAPIVRRLERWVARGAAIAIVYAALILLASVLAFLVVPATLLQVEILAVNAPAYVDLAQHWIDGAQAFLRLHVGRGNLPPGYGDLRALIAARIANVVTGALASLSEVLIGTFTAAFVAISSIVLSAFFVLRGERVADGAYDLLPPAKRATARALGRELAQVFGNFVSGQVGLCVITGALIFGFTAAVGFKFALLLGIIAGLAYAVPFVGMVAAHAIALGLSAPQGTQTTIWVQVIVFVIARVADNVLVPKVMSESVGVSPIVVMFSVFAGGELFGLPGLVLGIPFAALTKVAWRFFRSRPAEEAVEAVVGTEPTESAEPDVRPRLEAIAR